MNMFEILESKKCISRQVQSLCILLEETSVHNFKNFEQLFQTLLFNKWSANHGYISLNSFKKDLGINNILDDIKNNNFTEKELKIYLEYSLNIVYFFYSNYKNSTTYFYYRDFIEEAFNFLRNTLKDINYLIKKIDSDKYVIYPANEKLETVINKIKDEDVSYALFEYNTLDLQGNVSGKLDVLKRVANYYEGINKNKNKKDEEIPYINTMKDILSSAFNNCNIRHNNLNSEDERVKGNYNPNLAKLNSQQLEELYDSIYDLILDITILDDYRSNLKNRLDKYHDVIKNIKKD